MHFSYGPGVADPMDDAAREHLTSIGTRTSLRDGRVLFRQGDPADAVYLVAVGRIRIVLSTPTGRELLVATKGPGELVGELACLDARDRTATAIAEGPAECVVIRPDRFLEALEEHGALAVAILRDVSRQVRRADQRIASRDSEDIGTRLAGQLVELCETYGEHSGRAPGVELRINQDDLAAWIGTTRESVGRALARFRGDGLLTTGRGRIRIHDVDELSLAALG